MPGLEGQNLAGYQILAQLGEGGMGTVYKARQPVLIRLVALKIIKPQLTSEPGYVKRLNREAAAAAKFNHPNIVQIYTAGVENGKHFIAMEYVEGESVQERLSREGKIAPFEALAIALQVAKALKYGWERARIVHRDIKPDNIFLSQEGEVKLGDLGLAKSTGEGASLTQTGEAVGTPHYCSPEQAQGLRDIDCRSDIYSLGCTLYHMLAGGPPYDDETRPSRLAIIMRHLNEPPPDITLTAPDCPPVIAALLGKMLAKDRSERFQDYQELLPVMQEVFRNLQDRPTSIADAIESPTHLIRRRTARRRKSWALAGAAVLALGALAAWGTLFWRQRAAAALERQQPVATAILPPIAAPAPVNLVRNGSFRERASDGTPEGWTAAPGATGEIVEDGGAASLRLTGAAGGEMWFLQYVPRPPSASKVNISIRMRTTDFRPQGKGVFGLVIAQRNAAGELLDREPACMSGAASRNWKTMTTVVDLRPETAQLTVKLVIDQATGAVDFSDVSLEPR